MSSDPDDAKLRAAIAASLRDSRFVDLTIDSDSEEAEVEEVFPKSKSVIDSDTDKSAAEEEEVDDEDLKAALALSLEGVHRDVNDDDRSSVTTTATTGKIKTPLMSSEPSSLLGMDRKQMEQERLARLARRKADDGEDSLPQNPWKAGNVQSTGNLAKRKADDDEDSLGQSPWKVIKVQRTGNIDKSQTESSTGRASREAPTQPICNQVASNSLTCKIRPTARSIPQWPLGAVKKTALDRTSRQQDDITIEEVLQHGDLELAVLSSFLWDMDWLFSKLNTRGTRFVLVMSAKEEETRRQYLAETKTMNNLRLCFPPMEGQVNCMHSKLMLLFHPEYLRIAVPTANLTSTDWGVNNLMENSVFLIDLPKMAEQDIPPNSNSKPAFYHDLVYYLKATTLHENIIKKFGSFDFSKTARYAFVHTLGGTHRDGAWQRTGYCGLGRAVTNLGISWTEPIKVDYVTSSVGALTGDFLRAIYLACKGDDGRSEYTIRNSKTPTPFQEGDSRRTIMLKSAKEWFNRFHVYFPSEITVRSAHTHPNLTAGTICFQSSWWARDTFPHHALLDCESERDVLMHNKLLYVTPSKPIPMKDGKTQCNGWAYVGSANLSESAWGRLVKDRETKQPRLNCRNWECGVLVPIINDNIDADQTAAENEKSRSSGPASSAQQRLGGTDVGDAPTEGFSPDVFRDVVPVPMKTPALSLSRLVDKGRPRGDRKPWFFQGV